ncbi:hypothetical protein Tco_0800840 [Tanacetum coccineum]|uniref:Retrovirus-related Pol polyprotein from transposon TNT 1-94-like beta-barrel domain-containing protein n=1 Tax=Tanacetum coccineum TaxID=301880 RepID=A0ABQ4ZV81_9ASTR
MMTQKLGDGFEFKKKACFVCGSLNHLIKDYNFYENKMVGKSVLNNEVKDTDQREVRPEWNNAQRVNYQNKLTHPHPRRNFVSTAILTKFGQVPVNTAKQRAAVSISTARPVNAAAPKPKVNDALPITYSYFKAHSPIRRPFNQKSAAKTNTFKEKVNTARFTNVTTTGPKAVVNVAKGKRDNDVKSSACWIWRPKGKLIDHISKDSGSYTPKRFNYVDPQGRLKSDQGIFDSGCSRHMTGNKSYLTDYQEIDGGFVAFGGSPKGGKITRKGKIRTGKLDFEDTECLVLSPDFKLLDESQVLLKVPRQNNMYSFDLKNVVPSRGETLLEVCLQSYGVYCVPDGCEDCLRIWFQVTPKVSHLHAVKRIFIYLKGPPKLGLWYLRDSPFDLEAFSDSDYAGASLDRKSTTRGCQFLGKRLISWQCKKQTIVANSTTEAEMLLLLFAVDSTICIVKNPVFHSKTKHIEIRNHFISDSHEKKLIQDRQRSIVGFGEMRQLEVLRLILEEIGYNWYALTKNPTIYVSLIKKFWQTATVSTIDNGEQEIKATVDGKEFTITEAFVRRHLQLADADGKVSPQWRFLIHTILHCLSPKKTSWEHFSSNISTALVCLATNRTFKFSKLIFECMVKNLDSKYKFLMYPRFIQIFLDKNKRFLKPHNRKYIAPTLTPKLFSNMKRGFSREHTSLFPSMLALQAEEGEGSGNPSEPQPPPSTAQPTHEDPIPNIRSSSPQMTQTLRKALQEVNELPQTSEPTLNVPDEAVYKEGDDRVERATTTAASLDGDAEQDLIHGND